MKITSFQEIKEVSNLYRSHDMACLHSIQKDIEALFSKEEIVARYYTRLKHPCSIYEKMITKKKSFREIHDRLGMRIIVNCKHACYRALELLHTILKPVRTKDYIHSPKESGYRALHTVVIPPCQSYEHQVIEVQICTNRMSRVCGHGQLKHDYYKMKRKIL